MVVLGPTWDLLINSNADANGRPIIAGALSSPSPTCIRASPSLGSIGITENALISASSSRCPNAKPQNYFLRYNS